MERLQINLPAPNTLTSFLSVFGKESQLKLTLLVSLVTTE